MNVSEEHKKVMFDYLAELRDSGVTNMFGAGPYLESAFGLDRYEARDILLEWMQSFQRRAQ